MKPNPPNPPLDTGTLAALRRAQVRPFLYPTPDMDWVLNHLEQTLAGPAVECLRQLANWMRTHTGPADDCHEILCTAVNTLKTYDPEYPKPGRD